MTTDRPTLLLSVDFEDWHQLVRRRVGVTDWESPGPALERQTDAMLKLFDELGARATFFVLGMAARAHPQLVTRVVERGHEIALPRRCPPPGPRSDSRRVRRGPARRARHDRGADRPHARSATARPPFRSRGAARTGRIGSWPKKASSTTRASTTRRRCATVSTQRTPTPTASPPVCGSFRSPSGACVPRG